MTNRELAKIGLFALSVLFASELNVQGSEDDYRKDCPTAREWASTIDPEKRSSFLQLAESSVFGYGPDGPASTGIATLDLFFSLMTHAYQDIADYRDVYSKLFLDMSKEPVLRERFGETALLEIGQCMAGNQKVDCAQMALDKGYIKPLDDLIDEPSFEEALQYLNEICPKN